MDGQREEFHRDELNQNLLHKYVELARAYVKTIGGIFVVIIAIISLIIGREIDYVCFAAFTIYFRQTSKYCEWFNRIIKKKSKTME